MSEFALTVNGGAKNLVLPDRAGLADALRESLGLTGTHLGCEHGVCGACTVLIDGEPARSCITFAAACAGARITTIEGLDDDEIAGELRAAFRARHALQCGYCTPGMMVTARDLAIRLAEADERAIRVGLSGNLCRCTGYVGIVAAVTDVIAARRARGIAAIPGGGRARLGPVGAHTAAGLSAATATTMAPALDEAPEPAPAPFTPTHAFVHAFTLAQSPERVFAHFADVPAVAAAIPGVTLKSSSPTDAEGEFVVALGPVAARFRGRAEISRDEAARAGRILAAGGDAASRSGARGAIDYRVSADGEGARVELRISYALTGLLAQLGRPGLIETIARALIGDFAGNLECQLGAEVAKRRSPLAALWAAAREWLASWIRGSR